ncbi:cytochrome P450 [Xylariomycetidae sp. FL2044]|nr:cytochrome P450 [Xylariomycetidae sp. FL2044]
MLLRIFIAALALLATYLYRRIRYKRLKQFARFPQLPPSPIFGHLQVVDEFVKRAPPSAHADMGLTAMYKALRRPPVMLVDLRPISPPLAVIGSYEVAEQIVKSSSRFPYSPPNWKALRKRFNPGFAPQHLLSLLPSITDKAFLFLHHLNDASHSEKQISLQELATNLTFDVIGRVVLDIDMGAQNHSPTTFMQVFHELIQTYANEQITLPWWCTPRLEWRRSRLSKRVRGTLNSIVRERHAELERATKSRSILSMSLQGIQDLTPETVEVTCDQLSTFLFAGHDTTSTTLAWTFYELSRTPHALKAVRAELDELFGTDPDPAAVRAGLTSPGGEEHVYRMPYTSAVIKEVLRLWPPGGTARTTKPGDGLTVSIPSSSPSFKGDVCEMNMDGIMLYPIHSLIQRDPAVFGETANYFVPERWLGQGVSDRIPPGAWRAFERGPRNCIGQELALIEIRVVLALAVRRYNFTKIGIGAASCDETSGLPEVNEFGQYKVEEDMYMVTSKPVDGMMMKVKIIE